MDQTATESTSVDAAKASVAKPTSRLIEFPGVTRRVVPPWRKELSERVREVQERRAHEAAAEAEAAEIGDADSGSLQAPQLELLPQAEALPVNPLVTAALKRIERAHQTVPHDPRASYPATLSAAAGSTDSGSKRGEVNREPGAPRRARAASLFDDHRNDHAGVIHGAGAASPAAAVATLATLPAGETLALSEPEIEPAPAPERAVNLMVVPAPVAAEAAPAPGPSPAAAPALAPEIAVAKPRARRIISDDASDPALNYLDFVGVSAAPEADPHNRAPIFRRLIGGLIDLLTVCFLSVPFAAVVELRNGNWREPRVVLFMAGGAVVVMFIYLTVSTALTGKTLGTKLLSLRIIDTRTRLIPTGTQAAGRALVFILSLATAGIGLLFAFARGEGKTVHDRCSGTAVVRD